MSLSKKFQSESARVKGICFHPTRPWVITSLHSGIIQIWDFNMKIILATFDEAQGPVRCVDFHPHLPLFVSGADVGNIRLWNYKQKRCLYTFKGHIDYIRTTYFHHELPWILSASDDQTMRLWNYQSRHCINIITGHSHYVMCAQFHKEKNYIISASLDSTIRIWDFSILRKKLTQSKNLSGFVGIQIQCIKVLEGHEKGCNWACFHPSTNIIASGSDDRKIKLWKYTNEVAWEHSTILGHKNNVSCLLFDEVSQNLITNSEDKTLRIWNIESKSEIITEKKAKARYWILATNKKGSLLAAGHDEGFDIHQLNKERIPHAMISKDLIVFASGLKTYLFDVKSKDEKMDLYQYKEKTPNTAAYIEKIIENPFQKSCYMVQINEGTQQKFFMTKKKESYLNFPTLNRQFHALDLCFTNQSTCILLKTPKTIQITNCLHNSSDAKQIGYKSQNFHITRIFNTNKKNQLILVTSHDNCVTKMNVQTKKNIAKCQIYDANVRGIYWGFGKAAIVSDLSIVLVQGDGLQRVGVVFQRFPIKSVFWESQKILFYTTINHLKYAFLNGETGILKTLDEPFHILQKIEDNKFLAFDKKNKVFEIKLPDYTEIHLKLAINQRDVEKIKSLLLKIGECKKKIIIKDLVEKGFADLALNLVTDLEEKFSLAIQSSNFELAFEICNKVNTQEYWKMLGEEALKQGIFQAYEVACQKLKNFDQLNFLYSLQNNSDKLQKMLKIAKKTNNLTLAFNSNLFLNNGETYEEILRDAGLESLSQLSRQAFDESSPKSQLLKRLKCRPLTPVEAVGQDNFANWPHNSEPIEEQA